MGLSYLGNRNPYTDKTAFLYEPSLRLFSPCFDVLQKWNIFVCIDVL